MKNQILLLAFLLNGIAVVVAQPLNRPTYAMMITMAEEQMAKLDYYRALEWYKQAYEESRDADLAILMADLNYSLRDYRNASRWYNRALRPNKRNKNLDKWKDKRFEYARSLKMEGKYDEAIEQFDMYLKTASGPVRVDLAEQEQVGCEFAKVARPQEGVNVLHCGKKINTKNSEYSAWLSNDNKQMFFAGFGTNDLIVIDEKNVEDVPTKILQSSRGEKGWGEPKPLGESINRPGYHNVNVSISPDGKRMFFNRALLTGNVLTESKIFMSTGGGNSWSPAEEVESLNGDYIAKSPCAGELFGKEVMFFASNMEGGQGGYDIYYATYKGNGQYADPVNLPRLNTVGDEDTPFYRDGILYFSSTGHPGIGGYDIFMSTWNGTMWSKPQNMGMPYNSSADDLYFMLDEEGYHGLLTSNRIAEGARSLKSKTSTDDIYNVILKKIEADLAALSYDLETKEPLNGVSFELYEVNDSGSKLIETKTNKGGNNFESPLELDKSYLLIGSADNYENDTLEFNTVGLYDSKTYDERLDLKPGRKTITIRKEEPFVLENIYYDFDDDKILKEAEPDLNLILELMSQYPEMVIELSSHTDARGGDQYNRNLSQRRAESARRWLVAKGVERKRIVAKGYGESVPKTVNARIAQQNPFLKEGDVLTEDFIDALLPDTAKFEAAHQVNRRTEFKILSGPTKVTIEIERVIQIGNRKVDETLPKEEPKDGGNKPSPGKNRSNKNETPGGDSIPSFSQLEEAVQKAPQIHPLSSLYGKNDVRGLPIMQFDERIVDFGKVKKGEVREHLYTFTNLGDVPLAIDIASGCDCTTLDYSTAQVKPGEQGTIKVVFDSSKKDEDETVDVDIYLKNMDPEINAPIFERIQYIYELVK
jgi:peptidoglycan-associated lipoprotein